MSDENAPKTAAAMIVAEALKVVPQGARDLAGQLTGEALVKASQAIRDVAELTTWLTSLPRGAAALGTWVVRQWRRMPAAKRVLPSPTTLLTAAAAYAGTSDAELQRAFENLLSSAMDVDRAHRVHPSFARMLGEMTGVEARLLRLIRTGGSYPSAQALSEALAVSVDDHAFALAMDHLDRLGLVKTEPGVPLVTPAIPGDQPAPGWLSFGRPISPPMTENNQPVVVSVPLYGTYMLSTLGCDFIDVVDPAE